jgi:hypothetical protein
MYVIMRGNEFVTPPGSEKSYTKDLREARQYPDKAKAQQDCCGNERVVPTSSLLQTAQ